MAPIVALALLVGAFFLEYSRATGSIHIFHRTESGWQQLPPPPGPPDTLRISGSGTVWVLSLGREAATGRGASIVAGGGEAWVMDRGGNLSHFEGGQWARVSWAQHPDTGRPELARTANGARSSIFRVSPGASRNSTARRRTTTGR